MLLLWCLISGSAHAQSCTPNNNSSFQISGNTLSTTTPLAAGTYNVGIDVAMNGVTNSGACFPVTVTGQTLVSGACSATGSAAQSDLASVGFTACIVGNDFTQPIPNTAGTGIPNNWLNCTIGDTTPALWYYGFYGFITPTGVNAQNPCVSGSTANSSNSAVYQAIDPVYGNLALVLHAPAAHCTDTTAVKDNYTGGGCSTAIQSTPAPCTSCAGWAWPHSGLYPSSYLEVTYRTTDPADINTEAFWTWVPGAEQLRTSPGTTDCCYAGFEIDESLQVPGGWQMQTVQWVNHAPYQPDAQTGCLVASSPCGNDQVLDQSGLDSAYHTFAILFNTDGNNRYSVCFYFDGAKRLCHKNTWLDPPDQEERHELMWWANTLGVVDTYVYVKSINIISCAAWQTSMCHSSLVAPAVTINGAASATISPGATFTAAITGGYLNTQDAVSVCISNYSGYNWQDCGGTYSWAYNTSGQSNWSVTLTAPTVPGSYIVGLLPGGCMSCITTTGALALLTVQ